MKNLVLVAILAITTLFCAGQKAQAATFVGAFQVNGGRDYGDPGPYVWTNNPLCYTGQEAAALLFGGTPGDYWLSIDPSLDPLTITHTNHTDSWGGFDAVFAETYKVQTGTGYNDPYGGPSTSAYVLDHYDANWNYVWANDLGDGHDGDPGAPVVPEPCSMSLLGLGVVSLIKKRLFV